jgi:hypothetical protein
MTATEPDECDDFFDFDLIAKNQLAYEYTVMGPSEWHSMRSPQLKTYQDWCEFFDLLKSNGPQKGYIQ